MSTARIVVPVNLEVDDGVTVIDHLELTLADAWDLYVALCEVFGMDG